MVHDRTWSRLIVVEAACWVVEILQVGSKSRVQRWSLNRLEIPILINFKKEIGSAIRILILIAYLETSRDDWQVAKIATISGPSVQSQVGPDIMLHMRHCHPVLGPAKRMIPATLLAAATISEVPHLSCKVYFADKVSAVLRRHARSIFKAKSLINPISSELLSEPSSESIQERSRSSASFNCKIAHNILFPSNFSKTLATFLKVATSEIQATTQALQSK